MKEQLEKIQSELVSIIMEYHNGRFDNQLHLLHYASKINVKITNDFRKLVKKLGFIYIDVKSLDYFIDDLLDRDLTERDQQEINTMHKIINYYREHSKYYDKISYEILSWKRQKDENHLKEQKKENGVQLM